MGKRQSKIIVTNKVLTPETKTFKHIKYSKADKHDCEKFEETRRETLRMIKTQNTEQHTNE